MPFLQEHWVSLCWSNHWGVGFPCPLVGYPSLISGGTEKWFSRASVSFFISTCRVEAQVSCMLPRMFWSVLLSYLSSSDECTGHLIVVDMNYPERSWWDVSSPVLTSCICTLLYNMSTQDSACFIHEFCCFFSTEFWGWLWYAGESSLLVMKFVQVFSWSISCVLLPW